PSVVLPGLDPERPPSLHRERWRLRRGYDPLLQVEDDGALATFGEREPAVVGHQLLREFHGRNRHEAELLEEPLAHGEREDAPGAARVRAQDRRLDEATPDPDPVPVLVHREG